MSETDFTKGEWKIGNINYDHAVVAENAVDYENATVTIAKPNYHLAEHKANARLIAAAPDLLAACEEMFWMYKNSNSIEMNDVADYDRRDAAFVLVEKAIAKTKSENL